MSCHSTHVGVAATHYAGAITNLDPAQVASIFHRLKHTHADAPQPSAQDATAVLSRLKREALGDPRLDARTSARLARRYDKALAQIQQGTLPDGRTWVAMQAVPLEAELAERNLSSTLASSARHQRTSPARLSAQFDRWRATDDYEDIESPDPTYRLKPDQFPSDKRTQRALRKLGFENHLAQRHPCFVYGTLRTGQHNASIMRDAVAERSEEAHIEGIAIYGAARGFPYAQEAPDGAGLTRGDLVFLSADENGDRARDRLDGLEGFDSDRYHDSHYRRVEHRVTYLDPTTNTTQTTKAWVYLAGNYAKGSLHEADRIHSGDWVQARAEHAAYHRRNHRNWWDDIPEDDPTDHATDPADDPVADYAGPIVVKKSALDY